MKNGDNQAKARGARPEPGGKKRTTGAKNETRIDDFAVMSCSSSFVFRELSAYVFPTRKVLRLVIRYTPLQHATTTTTTTSRHRAVPGYKYTCISNLYRSRFQCAKFGEKTPAISRSIKVATGSSIIDPTTSTTTIIVVKVDASHRCSGEGGKTSCFYGPL